MPPDPTDSATAERRVAVGKRVRALRQLAGLSQAALAAAAGLDRSFLADVEAGKHSITVDRVFWIADALDIPVSTLFRGMPRHSRGPRSPTPAPASPTDVESPE